MVGAAVENGALIAPVTGTTRLMGILGDPIAQAKTPEAINRIFTGAAANILCVPIHVSAADLSALWPGLKAAQNLIGFGVTLPHKQAAASLCDRLEPLAAALGSANVVRREKDGSFCGYQFDGKGFLRGLTAQGHEVRGREVLLIGAGGAAIAITHALAEAGAANLRILNRTKEKAETLARTVNALLGKEICQAEEAAASGAGAGAAFGAGDLSQPLDPSALIVNATSLGLKVTDALPLDPALIGPGMLVADAIAQPEITPLLHAATSRGAKVHSGLHMIHGQVGLIAEHLAMAGYGKGGGA